ncbi:MAG TPA: aspartate aminotransferase [Chloroflexi bacterium]|jgi:aspartate/methionine/tyrosine aminotransferase|nr:aspartate aminotransferase [Chloroflexota bacterium]
MDLAKRMSRLGTETAFEVLARARGLEREGREIIHLEIGEPDFDTPRNVTNAGVLALSAGETHYTPSAGIDALREAISADQSTRKGIRAGVENVVVTPGGKPIMFFVMLALLEEGDEVIYPDPGFPIYESMVAFLGGVKRPIGFIEEARSIRWDVDSLLSQIGPRTKLLILNTPSNPVGCTVSSHDLARIAAAAVEHDVFVLSDEIYSRILYSGDFVSIATLEGMADRTCVLDGFSKTFAMTGWRLGFGVMPEWLAPHIARLITNSNSCTAAFTQIAGVEALTGPQDSVDDMVSEFRRRRDLVVAALNEMPCVRASTPDGAFYAFPNIQGTGMASREAADYFLYEAGVALLSGTAFGANGEGYLRLSYANSYENLERALQKMDTALKAREVSLPRG